MPKIDFTGKPGEYTYTQSEYGKEAYGVVQNGATSARNPSAQRAAGDEDREPNDHGGHLIPHSQGGRNDETNLDAQNANVNQIGQRSIERDVSRLAADPNKSVYIDVQNYNSPGSNRPDCTMITAGVLDKTTGTVDVAHYSLQNASYEEQDQWNQIAAQDAIIDPRQDIGMTPEERALANEYAEIGIDDDKLGTGYTVFFDSAAEPITDSKEVAIDDGVSLGVGENSVSHDFDDGVSLGMSDEAATGISDDGVGLGSDQDNSPDSSMDSGMDMD